MLRDQGNCGNPGKLPHQMAHDLDLLRTTAMDRDQDGIDRPLPDDSNGIRDRLPVDHGETAASGGINPGPLDGQ
jgi:hypothetical protein